MDAGRDLVRRAEALARHSDSPDHYTRTYLTPAHRAAARRIAAWMREAGMTVRHDAVGSVIGRYAGATPRAKTLLMGSHFDSVRNGGKYDGVLGVLVPIACVAELARRKERLPVAIEVAAFADEEGARFQTSFLASKAMLGAFDRKLLARRDADGVTLAQALRQAGLDPARVRDARIDTRSLAAYVEVHIEQGPVLLREKRALGVVTSIASGARYRFRVTGVAGHAGTVPMPGRRDALAAVAEMMVAAERTARAARGAVATVGVLQVKDGSGNVIPGEVAFTLDIRAPADGLRKAVEKRILARLASVARRRGVRLERDRTHEIGAAPCAPWLQKRLGASVARVTGRPARKLPSGAGHDAMVFEKVTDVGMLFVRCGAGGVSHNPAETVEARDAGLAAAALLDFLRGFASP